MSQSELNPQSLEVSVLGGFRLRANGKAVTVSRRATALLAYLSLRAGQPTSREAIADLIWSGRGPDQARHSLRQTLLELRHAFQAADVDPMRTGNGTVWLAVDRVRLDLPPEREDATVGGAPLPTGAQLTHQLGLYTSTLLDGFPQISSGFDEWLQLERTHWADRALNRLDKLARAFLAAGHADAAVQVRERAVVIDPLREDQHRGLMEAYAAAGRRADALRQYKDLTALLLQELNVPPAPETEALYQGIRQGNAVATIRPNGMAEPHAPFHDGRMGESHALERLILPRVEPRVAEGPPWIAVLPLRAAGPDPVPDYFAAGLADDIVSHLTTRQELTVISSASCLVFRDQPVDLMRVRAMLGVRYVVTGAVARSGNALRISVQLAETDNGTALWGKTYRTVDTELFDAQEHIAQQIVGTVIPRVREAELRRIQGKHASSLTAYDMVLRARDLTYRLEPIAFDEAGQLLRRARQMDPRYAVAHALYSDWLSLRIGQGWSPDPRHDAKQGDDAAHAAIASDHMNARALALLGRNRSFLFRDYAGAEAIFQRALDVAPNESSTWMWSACTLAYIGDSSGAVRRAERALDLSPYDPYAFRYFGALCLSHYTAERYEEAVHWGQRAIADNPHYTSNLRFTTAAMSALGREDAARRLGAEIMRIDPGFRLSALREQHPYQDPRRRAQIADHLRAAGLPE